LFFCVESVPETLPEGGSLSFGKEDEEEKGYWNVEARGFKTGWLFESLNPNPSRWCASHRGFSFGVF
jgi:hypothetical protein